MMKRYVESTTRLATFTGFVGAGEHRAVNEVEQETLQDNTSEDIEMVSINSAQFSNNHSLLTDNLKMSVNTNTLIVPYKIETGGNGNIISAHTFKRLFPKVNR